MKKLLLGTAAVGLALSAAPASAAIDLELGGTFKGYGVYTDQDDNNNIDGKAREFDILRSTNVTISGETTLDNGLAVGAYFKLEADGDKQDSMEVSESYVYFAGNWGRVNFGAENGAAYLLQVAAPSADSNVDGLRASIHPINYAAASAKFGVKAGSLDYEDVATHYDDKLTYLSPIVNGFQAGLSYTPDTANDSTNEALNTTNAASTKKTDFNGNFGSAYELSARYEGELNGVGVIAGAGYTQVEEEGNTDAADDREVFNVGLDLNIGPFGIGTAYKNDNGGKASATKVDDEETYVVGVDYTTGPFKLGASYLSQENVGTKKGLDANRYTGGVVYTYGPGMTFRGSISHVEYANVTGLSSGKDFEATSVLLGTQIKF